MNPVHLAEVSASARRRYGSGVAGAILQPWQFNPAVSRRTPFAADFLGPQDAAAWRLAIGSAGMARLGHDDPLPGVSRQAASATSAAGDDAAKRSATEVTDPGQERRAGCYPLAWESGFPAAAGGKEQDEELALRQYRCARNGLASRDRAWLE